MDIEVQERKDRFGDVVGANIIIVAEDRMEFNLIAGEEE